MGGAVAVTVEEEELVAVAAMVVEVVAAAVLDRAVRVLICERAIPDDAEEGR